MALTETHFHRTESSPGLSMSTVHCPCPMSTRLMVKVWDVRRANPPDGSTRLQPTPIGGRGFESLILCPRLCEVDVHCVSMVVITRISSPYSVCDMVEKEKKRTHQVISTISPIFSDFQKNSIDPPPRPGPCLILFSSVHSFQSPRFSGILSDPPDQKEKFGFSPRYHVDLRNLRAW